MRLKISNDFSYTFLQQQPQIALTHFVFIESIFAFFVAPVAAVAGVAVVAAVVSTVGFDLSEFFLSAGDYLPKS